jgi:hypothetical protein
VDLVGLGPINAFVPNTISGARYLAVTGDGHCGYVTSRSGSHEPEAPDLLSVIDLADVDLKVVQTIKLPNPKMVLMHPHGCSLQVGRDALHNLACPRQVVQALAAQLAIRRHHLQNRALVRPKA